jgi:hypothetical protein
MAQALFGAHSPLPLRTVRLPSTDADAPPVDLPYLESDDTAEAAEEDVVVDADPATREPAAEPTRTPPPPTPQAAAAPTGLSLWDVEYAYVAEHPDDGTARLDLARKLYGVGAVERSLEQYAVLAEGDVEVLPDVIRDLNLLVHLYPESTRPKTLLAAARARARQVPES